jgi:hypothetical protein
MKSGNGVLQHPTRIRKEWVSSEDELKDSARQGDL